MCTNAYLQAMCHSYKHWTGSLLVPADRDTATALWESPFAIAAHNHAEDPVFVYANAAALRLFKTTLSDLMGTLSRYTASEMGQSERNTLLEKSPSDRLCERLFRHTFSKRW